MTKAPSYLNGPEKNVIERFVKLIRAALVDNVADIEFFGSKVRGDFTASSDIDILIIVKKRTLDVMDKVAEITSDLNLEYNLSLSPVVFSEEEYKRNADMGSPFSLSIAAEGVKL